MKKIIAFFIAIGCLFIVTGCSNSDSGTSAAGAYKIGEAGTWSDGTYTETAAGKKGNFEVTVVIQDGNIASVVVGDNEETPDRGGGAIAQLPDEIVKTQSYLVDAVTGANG